MDEQTGLYKDGAKLLIWCVWSRKLCTTTAWILFDAHVVIIYVRYKHACIWYIENKIQIKNIRANAHTQWLLLKGHKILRNGC